MDSEIIMSLTNHTHVLPACPVKDLDYSNGKLTLISSQAHILQLPVAAVRLYLTYLLFDIAVSSPSFGSPPRSRTIGRVS